MRKKEGVFRTEKQGGNIQRRRKKQRNRGRERVFCRDREFQGENLRVLPSCELKKQLRISNDELTWLTAALLQLAPDQQYMLPTSSDTSFIHSPLATNNADVREAARRTSNDVEIPNQERRSSMNARMENLQVGSSANDMAKGFNYEKRRYFVAGVAPHQKPLRVSDMIRMNERQVFDKGHKGIEELWLEVLERIQVNGLKEFLYKESKLISVNSFSEVNKIEGSVFGF